MKNGLGSLICRNVIKITYSILLLQKDICSFIKNENIFIQNHQVTNILLFIINNIELNEKNKTNLINILLKIYLLKFDKFWNFSIFTENDRLYFSISQPKKQQLSFQKEMN